MIKNKDNKTWCICNDKSAFYQINFIIYNGTLSLKAQGCSLLGTLSTPQGWACLRPPAPAPLPHLQRSSVPASLRCPPGLCSLSTGRFDTCGPVSFFSQSPALALLPPTLQSQLKLPLPTPHPVPLSLLGCVLSPNPAVSLRMASLSMEFMHSFLPLFGYAYLAH